MSEPIPVNQDVQIIEKFRCVRETMLAEIHKVVIGQDEVIHLLIQAMLSRINPWYCSSRLRFRTSMYLSP